LNSDTDIGLRTSNIELKTHEIPTKTVTPNSGPSWYIKWIASIFVVVGLFLNTHEFFPLAWLVQSIGLFGWFIVAFLWNDRALMIINVVGLTLLINGFLVQYFNI